MSKIVLVFENDQYLDYFSTLIQGVADEFKLLGFTNTTEARTRCLEEGQSVLLYMIQGNSHASREFIDELLNKEVATPLIILEHPEQLSLLRKRYKSQTLLDYFELHATSDALFKKIEKLLDVSSRSQTEKVYCKVNLSFFYSTKEVFCDVYIKISDDKYVKVLNRYDVIDPTDIKKFDKKEIKYLYVRKRDFALITKKLVKELRPLSYDKNQLSHSQSLVSCDALNTIFSIQLQETVTETIQKIGLSNEAIEMTNIAINSTMELIGREPEIYQMLQNTIKGQNYCSEHSFLLSYLSCALLKETSLGSQENLISLTIAAFFHDVALEDRLCQIQSTDERAFQLLGVMEQEEVTSHPELARVIIEKVEGIAKNVGSIILQHHEKYDGSGFPMGLDFKRISPLSAVFNVAHELALYIFESGKSDDNIKAILKDMNTRYPEGNYATAMEAAFNIFDTSLIEKKAI